MSIPSIAMIPSGYKANKVYSVLPTDGSGDLVTARTSTATRVNQNGLIETVAGDVPRLDYTDGGCPSLLLEGNSTNLITYSEDYSDASWAKSNLTVTSNSTVSPSGDVDADLIDFTAVSNYLDKSGTITIGQVYTVSCYVKSATSSNQNFIMYANANKNDGVLSATSEWQRFTYTFTADGTAMSSGLGSDELSQIYAWGFQLEQGQATSYIKTEGTTISRTADSAYLGGLNAKGLINDSAIVLYFENDIQSNTVNQFKQFIALYNDAFNAGFRLETRIDNSVFVQQSGLITSGDNFNSFSLGANSVNFKKIAVYLTTTQFKVFADGVQVGATLNGVYVLDFDNIGFSEYNQTVEAVINSKDLRIYNTALSSSELQILTTI